jgi:hypothetical protein
MLSYQARQIWGAAMSSNPLHEMIVGQLNRQGERLDAYNATLDRLTITVEEHVRRTNMLEQQLKPIKAHVDFINTLSKFVSVGAAFLVALRSLHII